MITHDPSLVVLSASLAMLGAFTASVMTTGLGSQPRGEATMRLVMATVSLGGSIWASLFVGLLAMEAAINWTYNPIPLALAALAALAGTGTAFFLTKASRGSFSPAAVAVLGLSLVGVQYLGLEAIAGRYLQLSWFLAVIVLAFSIQVAAVLMWFLFRPRGVVITLIGAFLLGLGICAIHFLSIVSAPGLEQALSIIPPDPNPVAERYLAWSVTIMMYLICSICLCLFVIMQFQEEL